jgi:UDP-3-O-[3-hydroxymyristoyl] N-acetylglucosamine deacetylase
MMSELGLGGGGRLDNFILVGEDNVINTELRFPDEFVRHKVLDTIGDLYTAGGPIIGRFIGRRAGHTLHNQLLRALFADPHAWRPIDASGVVLEVEPEPPLRRVASA